jgi:hypothetical protein
MGTRIHWFSPCPSPKSWHYRVQYPPGESLVFMPITMNENSSSLHSVLTQELSSYLGRSYGWERFSYRRKEAGSPIPVLPFWEGKVLNADQLHAQGVGHSLVFSVHQRLASEERVGLGITAWNASRTQILEGLPLTERGQLFPASAK